MSQLASHNSLNPYIALREIPLSPIEKALRFPSPILDERRKVIRQNPTLNAHRTMHGYL